MRKAGILIRYLGLFFIPITVIFFIFVKLKFYPFGEGSIWYIDLPAQLTYFYNHLYEVFRGNSSAIYTWNYGMGTSFWATIWYYLSSPLSILILVLPKSFIPYSILITWVIKVGLSSLTMSYLLKKYFTPNQFVIFIFSIGYALMSFSITYYFLPMWIDAVYLLPIITAGVHDIIKKEKHYLFLISLTILFFANFYISYMVGIFVFIYFAAECFINQFNKRNMIKRFTLFFKSVFLAFLFTSFVTVPTYLEIRKNKYTTENVDIISYFINPIQNPLNLYGNLFNGTTQIQNLSIFTGLVILILVPLYFLNKSYRLRERLAYGLLLAFLFFSMTNKLFNFAWHVFETPNGAHFRYGFIVSFLMILLSVKAIIKLESSSIRQLVGVTGFNVFFLSIANKLLDPNLYSLGLIYKNMIILLLYSLFILVLMLNKSTKILHFFIKVFFGLLVIIDMGLNTQSILENYLDNNNITKAPPYDWYNKNNPSYEKALDKLYALDQSFYRTKVDASLISATNESLRYKYKGMSIYTSTGNSDFNMSLRNLGYQGDYRAVRMGNGIFSSDVLLGFKYFVTTRVLDERIYTKVIEEENLRIYKMNLNLPLGFVVNKNFMNFHEQSDVFSVQNRLIIGPESDGQLIYEKLDSQIKLNSLKIDSNHEGIPILIRETGDSIPSLEAILEVSDTRELYMQVDDKTFTHYDNYMEILVNNSPVAPIKLEMGDLKIFNLGTYENETLTVTLRLKNSDQNIQVPVFYTFNYSNFKQEINKLNRNPLKINDYSDTKITGEITIPNNQDILFTSIPYDENWKLKVDGMKADYQKMGGFIAIELSKGKHKIQLEYSPKYLYISVGVSVISLLAYLGLTFYNLRRKRLSET
jgi:uncharacterized membrane protein YfhO